MRNFLWVMTVFSVLTMPRAYKNEDIILFVKQGQDGISMDEFLSDTNSNQTLNISNIVQNKLNYKSQLMDRIYTDQLESLTLQLLNVFGDVLFWITYLHPTVNPGFKIQSQLLSSSHRIDQSSCEIQRSSYYWQYAKDRTGIWYAIYEGFHLANIPNYPKFIFSGSKTKGNDLLNGTCHCGQVQRYTLADIASCPVCEELSSLRCPTERNIFAAYRLNGSGVINAAPLYMTTGVYVHTPQIYYGQQQLYYSPWEDCSSYQKLESLIPVSLLQYFNDMSVVVPVFCLKLTHQRSLPFGLTLTIPVPTGGNFLVAQSMVVSGKWTKQNSTTTAQISGTSIDQNSNVAPSTTHFSSPQYERTGNTIQTYNSDKVPPHPTSKQMPSQKRTSSHTDIVSPKPSGEFSKLPSLSNKCKSCTCVNITNHLTLNNVNISLKEIKSKLLLPQKNLSSYIRQKRSADDDRRSAADMGYVGLAIIIACVSWVVSSDVVHMLYIIKCVMARQLCQASKKEQRK
uniref:Uncharacterized protein n=1 Tax=Magallana gigas TaxID=29159 RepID=K1QHS2_MAGGI